MDDHRLAQLESEREVTTQVAQLVVARREATVVVESRFANSDDRGSRARSAIAAKVAVAVARDVRVDARAGVERRARANS